MNCSFNAVDRYRTDGTYHEIHRFFFEEAVPLLFFKITFQILVFR